MIPDLTSERAQSLAEMVLGHVTRPYPHKLDHVLAGPAQDLSPEALHPIFYGSFDWHSCVQGYWSLARLLRRFPSMAVTTAIADLFERQFTPAKVAAEVAYFGQPSARGFERPYGWAWLLKLAAELQHASEPRWAQALQPLAELIALRFAEFLPLALYPVRSGAHGNTAFALILAADYARNAGEATFLHQLGAKANAWYAQNRACQAWEPSADDFISPALTEAACMARLLPRDVFRAWFDGFLPDLAARRPATLFEPAVVTDRADGKLAHLDGLNFSRAWCARIIAAALGSDDPRTAVLLQSAAHHLAASVDHLDDDYMGSHWLASFALLAFDDAGLELEG